MLTRVYKWYVKCEKNVSSLKVLKGLKIELPNKVNIILGKSIKKVLGGMFTLFLGQ